MTAAPRIAVESRKCTATQAGFSLVSTTIPPTTAWPITPPGSAAASHTRSRRRRLLPGGRYCHAAMNAKPAMSTSGKFSSRLPNSIQVFRVVWPAVLAATRLRAVQLGQSGQPSPDLLSRTASPVDMMTALAITEASARPRIAAGVGRHTSPDDPVHGARARRAQRRARAAGAVSAGTLPIVGVPAPSRPLTPHYRP